MGKKDQYHYRWHATVYPNSMHLFQREIEGRTCSNGGNSWLKNFDENTTTGNISRAAAKRIERAIVWLLYHSKQKTIYDILLKKQFKFRINFITLTLPAPQVHSDDAIKKVALNNFLTICRKTHGLINYVWKAEAQINGNIHFHLVTDTYIRYNHIQEIWNRSLNLLSTIPTATDSGGSYIDRFEAKIGHRHPNSTDVHSVKHVKKIASYVSKYMSKNRAFKCVGELRIIDGKQVEVYYGSDEYRAEEPDKKNGKIIANIIDGPIRKIDGRLWFLSRSLSQCKAIRLNEDDHQFADLSTIIHKAELHQFSTDFCFSYYGKVASAAKQYAPWLHNLLLQNAPQEKLPNPKPTKHTQAKEAS